MSKIRLLILSTIVPIALFGVVLGVTYSSRGQASVEKSERPNLKANDADDTNKKSDPIKSHALKLIDQGRNIFRFDTFGDEDFWGGTPAPQGHSECSARRRLGIGPES